MQFFVLLQYILQAIPALELDPNEKQNLFLIDWDPLILPVASAFFLKLLKT